MFVYITFSTSSTMMKVKQSSQPRLMHTKQPAGVRQKLDDVFATEMIRAVKSYLSSTPLLILLLIRLFQKKILPPSCWGYQLFQSWSLGFPVDFIMTPPPMKFKFLLWTPWKSTFFHQILTYPPGIPTTFGLNPWNYPQQGIIIFFWKSPLCTQCLI